MRQEFVISLFSSAFAFTVELAHKGAQYIAVVGFLIAKLRVVQLFLLFNFVLNLPD